MTLRNDADCAVCEDELLDGVPMGFLRRRFIVCPDCGNKRYPKASWHLNQCTGSNEPGQHGSFYGPEEHWPRTPHVPNQDSTKGK